MRAPVPAVRVVGNHAQERLARHQVGDFILALRHDVADPAQDVATGRCRRSAPDLEPATRRLDGTVDIRCTGHRKAPDPVVDVRGITILVIFATDRWHPIAADEVLESFHE
jgi:hypothetical protein